MRKFRILVVDPHTDSAESLRMLLNLWGHEARTAASGISALCELEAFEADLVLAETTLTDMDSPELVQRIASAYGRRTLPLLAQISSSRQHESSHYSVEFTFDYQFGKPLNLTFLNRVLQFHRDRLDQFSEPFPRRIRSLTQVDGAR